MLTRRKSRDLGIFSHEANKQEHTGGSHLNVVMANDIVNEILWKLDGTG